MTGIARYQGAIIKAHHILLIKQTEHASGRSYWLIPGGGIEPGETEEQCVQREMLEETGLHVQVHSLLRDEPSTPGAIYQRWKTYRCAILAGEARPGSEPEAVYADAYSFTEVGWFDLRHPATWNERLAADSYSSSLKFPFDKPMPFHLIRRVVQFRAKENAEKVAAKEKK